MTKQEYVESICTSCRWKGGDVMMNYYKLLQFNRHSCK